MRYFVQDEDEDFGDIGEINPTSKVTDSSLPSQKIDRDKIAHLSEQQQEELLNLLDQFSECFADRPGFCDLMQQKRSSEQSMVIAKVLR